MGSRLWCHLLALASACQAPLHLLGRNCGQCMTSASRLCLLPYKAIPDYKVPGNPFLPVAIQPDQVVFVDCFFMTTQESQSSLDGPQLWPGDGNDPTMKALGSYSKSIAAHLIRNCGIRCASESRLRRRGSRGPPSLDAAEGSDAALQRMVAGFQVQ